MTQAEQRQLEADTRQRLLNAAGEVFADRGFRNATIRDICKAAGVNIAAVNYHFGDKESLYREVIQFAAHAALDKYPPGGGLGPDASAEDRLRAFVRNYLARLLDEGRPAWHGQLISREIVEPSSALDELTETFVRPQYTRLRAIITELLGPAATEERIRGCTFSLVGQCLFYKHCRPLLERMVPDQRYTPEARAELTRHVTDFTLRALRSLRAGAEPRGAHP